MTNSNKFTLNKYDFLSVSKYIWYIVALIVVSNITWIESFLSSLMWEQITTFAISTLWIILKKYIQDYGNKK